MPNMKIYVDHSIWEGKAGPLARSLPVLKSMMCDTLGVPIKAAHVIIIQTIGADNQPLVSAEVQTFASEQRSKQLLDDLSDTIRDHLTKTCETVAVSRIQTISSDSSHVAR